jgi:hypothetical protein
MCGNTGTPFVRSAANCGVREMPALFPPFRSKELEMTLALYHGKPLEPGPSGL